MNAKRVAAKIDFIIEDLQNMKDQILDLDTGKLFWERLQRVQKLLGEIDHATNPWMRSLGQRRRNSP